MIIDQPMASSSLAGSSLEDFLHMDMLTSSSNNAGSSSRSSSNSPSTSFAELPVTPPNPFETTTSEFFNFYLDDDFAKVDPYAMSSATPFDFLSVFPPTEESSPDSGSPSSSGTSPVTIDPTAVTTPSVSGPMSDFDEDEEPFEDDGEESDRGKEKEKDDMVTIEPLKVGGKGKNRKGTVQSGGIAKKISDKKKETKPAGMLTTTSVEADDWRPTPEEYKKMSSKEKRQLRNKISARNFRVRRKEYINTLEGDIAERDRLIDAIRNELGSTKSENTALRQEIAALKKALLDGRGRPDTPVLPPPGPLPAIPAAITALQSPPATPKSPALLVPNMHKDVPMSPRMSGRSFWGGNLGGFGGVTPVHTTLVPDLTSVLSGKPILRKGSPTLQENINPALNRSATQDAQGKTKELSLPMQMTPFDSFTDITPFTLKSLDAYRMQLWGRMAQQQAAQPHHTEQSFAQQQQQQQQPQLTGLASGLRPHYFAKSPTLSAILAGKPSTSGAYPTPPPSPPTALRSASQHNQSTPTPMPTEQQAMLASIASQTLLGKLGNAFWDAFSGGSHTGRAQWDADKVRRVLEGKAVVRVVDIEPQPTPASPSIPVISLDKAGPSRPQSSPRMPPNFSERCSNCLVDMIGSLRI